jgi:predicted enzyme related to lactoylglutathione lyase
VAFATWASAIGAIIAIPTPRRITGPAVGAEQVRERGRLMRKTSYLAGTPTWVDLGTPDIDATTEFYGGLFGWKANETGEDHGGYVRYALHGADVAGAAPLMSEAQPIAWTSYFAVDDADATAARISDAGGQVIAAPMDVMDLGRMGVFVDPTGAAFGIWQAGTFAGAGLVNEPGAFTWNELLTRNAPASIDFYHAAFGLTSKASAGTEVPYTELQVDGASVAGLMDISGPQWPAEMPPQWVVYFDVADCEVACAKAQELGGTVVVPPTDIPIGRFAVLIDPQGASFSIIQMNE